MAGLGDDYYIGKDQLKAAFKAAQEAGDDQLVHYHEATLDLYATHIHQIDCYSLHTEKTASYSKFSEDSVEEENEGFHKLARHIASHGTDRIIEVYDLSKPFEEAAGGVDLLPPELFDQAAEYRALDEREQTPWYKKFFGFRS